MTRARTRPWDAVVRKWPRRCRISEWDGEGIGTTSGGMLVRECVPWELGHAQTECWILVVVSFAVVTVAAAVVHNSLWKTDAVGDETGGRLLAHRTRYSVRCL